jgi:prolyl oligopeptidase
MIPIHSRLQVMRNFSPAVLVAAVVLSTAAGTMHSQPPLARRQIVADRFHGLTILDPYRWMEQPSSAEFTAWLRQQDAHTDAQLLRLPGRAALRASVLAAMQPDDAPRRMRRGGQRLFYLRRSADSLPPTLRWFALDSGAEQELAATGALARHDPSPDGTHIALTAAGSGAVAIVTVADGRVVDSLPARAQIVGWDAEPDAVLYTITSATRRELRRHHLRTSHDADRRLVTSGANGAPRWRDGDVLGWRASTSGTRAALLLTRDDEIISIHVSERAPPTRTHAAHGSMLTDRTPPRAHLESMLRWRTLAVAGDTVSDALWHGQRLVMLARAGVIVANAATAGRDTIVMSRGRALLAIARARDGTYLLDGTGGEASLQRLAADGRAITPVALPITGSGRTLFGDPAADGVVLPIDRWLGDGGWYTVDPERRARLPLTRVVEPDTIYVESRRMVRNADGTMVPLTVLRRRDTTVSTVRLTWLMAYGAYGIAMTPRYQSLGPALRGFLDAGGIYAVAHVRGGGELGALWHDAGRASRKPNAYRDLIACAEALIADSLARADRLVVEGSSGGGATVGMAAVTRPDLFRVVITNVPDANTLRLHATPDGPWMRAEWGDIRTAQGRAALAAMDLTQHVQDTVAYPAWLLSTGLLDTSVPPWLPAKLAATLQRAPLQQRPVLLRALASEGHVFRPPAATEHVIDMLSFAYWQTGHPDFQIRP